jgi:hypothetical protein
MAQEFNTRNLTGAALDWAVAMAIGAKPIVHGQHCFIGLDCEEVFNPSDNPVQGQPIMDREGIATWRRESGWSAACPPASSDDHAQVNGGWYDPTGGVIDFGPEAGVKGAAQLQAAMRALVVMRLGEVVEVPEELGIVNAVDHSENVRHMGAAPTEQPLLPIGILVFGADENRKPSYHHACDDATELVRVLDEGLTGGPYRAVPVYDLDTLRVIVASARRGEQ